MLLAVAVLALSGAWVARWGLRAEQESFALSISQLFEASLQNAMLNRDLSGMQAVLAELGGLPGVAVAQLLAPGGEVRFGQPPAAAGRDRVGEPAGQGRVELLAAGNGVDDSAARTGVDDPTHRDRADALEGLCLVPGCPRPAPVFRWLADGGGLRVAYPILNQARCAGCHGSPEAHPVNGVLLTVFEDPSLPSQWRRQLPALAAIGILTIAALSAAVWLLLRGRVLRPVQSLGATARALADGDRSARAGVCGRNELGRLAETFNLMAARNEALITRLEDQRAYLQRLIDAVPDPVVVIDDGHRIVDANAAYRRLVGHDDPVGQPCHRVSRGLDAPCAPTMVRCPLVELREGTEPMRCVMQFRRADGTMADFEIDAAPMPATGSARQVIEILHPLEETLRFSQEQRLSSVGLLANGVAHEIHNPLASIRIALQAMQRSLRAGPQDPATLFRYLELVDSEIDRCVAITQRLMRLSQPPNDALAAVALKPTIEETLSLLSGEMAAGGVAVRIDVAPPGLLVRADDSEFRMLVLNLVQNAIHAMPGGGALEIRARASGGQCTMTVRDTGVGIRAEDLPLIFVPFFSRRADGRRGTGLGLAICRGSVERWGGTIWVSSEIGKGSVFSVMIPSWQQ